MIKLKDLIKKSILEQVSTISTTSGAKPVGYKSDKTDELEKAVTTATTDYEAHQKAEPVKYEWTITPAPTKKNPKPKPEVKTGNTPPKGVKYTTTKEWEKWNTTLTSKLDIKNQKTDDLEDSRTSDVQDTKNVQEPPVGVTKVDTIKSDEEEEEKN